MVSKETETDWLPVPFEADSNKNRKEASKKIYTVKAGEFAGKSHPSITKPGRRGPGAGIS